MATLAQIQTFAIGDPVLKQRFQAARLQAAWDILAENNPAAPRVAWRNKILNNVSVDVDREYLWVLSHTLVQATGASITDANLVTATKSFIDTWATL